MLGRVGSWGREETIFAGGTWHLKPGKEENGPMVEWGTWGSCRSPARPSSEMEVACNRVVAVEEIRSDWFGGQFCVCAAEVSIGGYFLKEN